MPIETQHTRTKQLEDSKEVRNESIIMMLLIVGVVQAVISGPANPAADPRQIRRVIAEDPDW